MAGESFPSLVDVLEKLLAPDGCPWDREQTFQSLKAYLLEEAHELIEAIDGGDADHHREELGDVLFQVIFQAALARREKGFGIDDVIASLRDKLVRRHPHVFAGAQVESAKAQVAVWEKIKSEERAAKGEKRRALRGVPVSLPALQRAWRLGEKASVVGFDWASVRDVMAKVREELAEVDEALARGDGAAAGREIGDLLFAVAQLARLVGVEPEDRLRATIAEFTRRFEFVEDRLASLGRTTRESTQDEMEALWQEAKKPRVASQG